MQLQFCSHHCLIFEYPLQEHPTSGTTFYKFARVANKLLQNEWLIKQTCIVSYFWRLEVRHQSFKGLVPSEPGKKTLFHASLPASGGFLAIFDIARLVEAAPRSLPSFPHGILLVCVQNVSFYQDTSKTGIGTPLTPVRTHLNHLHLQ